MTKNMIFVNWIDTGEGDSCMNVKHIVNKEKIEVGAIVKAKFNNP